ncbi:hypothetical protein, partial [Gordonia westfalica]|uniref:hypothetical protein n=1 Tax=Gordonia westfalica TaxID=158898 RepID=UPI001AD84F5F
MVEPPSIDYVVQQETPGPHHRRATHFLLTVSMPETPTQEYPSTTGKQSAVSEWTDDTAPDIGST